MTCDLKLLLQPWHSYRFFSLTNISVALRLVMLPRLNSPAQTQTVLGNSDDFVEAVCRVEIFRIFSNVFQPVPAGKHRKLAGIHWKKFGRFPAGILLPFSSISGVFLQDAVPFSHLSCTMIEI